MNPFHPPNGSMTPFPPFPNMPFPPPGFPNMPFPPPGFPRPPNAPPGFPNLPPWNTSGIPMQNAIVKPPVVNPLQHSTHQITTVYVGKIAAGIEDEFVRKLLEQCGRIANWRRMSDPVSGKLKGFGFCDFESPQGAITSLNCLNGLTLGDQALLIKVDEKTQKLLDEYVLKREQAKKLMPATNNDNTPKTLDEIFGDYVRVKNVISQLIEVRERGGNYRIISVDSELNRFKPADNTTPTSEVVEKPREKPKPKQEDEKPEERDKVELEREARRKEREERDYLQREEEWEMREKNKMRDRARDNERLAYERDRARRDLLEYDDNERKKRTREYIRRKRERERELQEDEADRAREIQEEEFKRREEQRRQEELEREREKELQRLKELELEREKARLQSMMDATMESSPSPAWSPGADDNNSDIHRSQSGEFGVSSPSGITGIGKFQVQLAPATADKKKQKPVPIMAGFDEEPEDDDNQGKRKRKLEVLEGALHADKKTRSAKLELAKSLIERIPTEKEQLFAYEMDWDTIQQHNILEVKMRPWVSKKIVEYLGEEEKSLIDFILLKISAKMPPPELLGYIQPVLDEEADSFLVKLWRMLIFEMLSATAAVPK